jgi:TRAP-type C4-dicarboxylate transport system substrate-binding protein
MHPGKLRPRLGLVATSVLALTISACGGAGGGDAAGSIDEMDKVTLSFHTAAPPEHPNGVAAKAFVEEVVEETDGKVAIEVHYSNSLLPDSEDLSGIETGVADMGVVFATRHPEELPVVNWLTTMQSLRSGSMPHGFLQSSAALQKIWTVSEPVQKEAGDHNLVLLGGAAGPSVGLLCNEPIASPAEAKGVRVRVGGPVWSDEAEAMGFTPVSMPTSETYEALQREVVDCEMAHPSTIIAFAYWDVAKYYHPVAGSGSASTLTAVNKDTWESLPSDAQDVLRTAADNYIGRVLDGGFAAYKDFAEQSDEGVVTIVDPRPLNKVLYAHQDAYIQNDVIADAPSEVSDPEAFVQEWRSALEWGMDLAVDNVGTEPEDEALSPEEIRESYLTGGDPVDMPKFLSDLRAAR